MLNNVTRRSARRAAGFSLVELMVAMVIGLIVIGAVIALVLSMMRANNQTIGATRLTQELRATAALMANDLRRAGGVIDPLTVATADDGDPDNPFEVIDTATAGCIRYSYEDAEGGNFHSIFVANNAVHIEAAATFAGADCTANNAANSALSSQQVRITELTFERQSPCGTPNPAGRCIRITLEGEADAAGATFSRRYTHDVYVRSMGG
jgi:prepilin-type N-terminal cleavage/methylation domain-containing protein